MIGSVASSAIKQVRFGSTAETKACPLHPQEADMLRVGINVCFVPIADIGICGQLTAAPSRADGNDVASIELR